VTQKRWYAAEVKTTASNREAIEYGLMEGGALGTETIDSEADTCITGYFAAAVDEAGLRKALGNALHIYGFSGDDAFQLNVCEFPDHDWLAEWKANWQPVAVGRFIIAPPWLSEPPAVAGGPGQNSIFISINPGMAFGTGTHETTRLCLKAIERHFEGGSFLDVGTGTGILAIAAAKMPQKADRDGEPAAIIACDVDANAVDIAKENANLNRLLDRIDFRIGSIDEKTESADLVCANLTAPVIVDLLPALLGATCGRLVLSGILDSQIEMVKARLLELAVVDFEIDQDGEWIAMVI
jgi:ribosomal protein L11 methyltransferase